MIEKNTIDHDEVKQFLDARIVTPTEAVWRILEFPLFDRSHSIKMLPVHLPGEQMYFFDEDMDEDMLREKISLNTELLAYFELNKTCDFARKLYYHEIPKYFKLEKGKWIKRARVDFDDDEKSQAKVIGRLVKVMPSESERYYLRLLLLHVKGATSFEEIRTVNDILCCTFAEACLALGLIRDDEEWKKAIQEAHFYMMPAKLRLFFSLILVHCAPSKPEELWSLFKRELSEDFLRTKSESLAHKMAYMDIAKKIIEAGKNMDDFPTLPPVEQIDISEESDFSQVAEREIGNEMYEKMNGEQKAIVDMILKRIFDSDNKPAFYFLNGSGGVGKTFVNKTLCHLVRGNGKKYAAMAFTGIAANLMPGGRTMHNRFGLNLEMTSSKIGPASQAWNELKETALFILDEAPMVDNKGIEIIDHKLKEIMESAT